MDNLYVKWVKLILWLLPGFFIILFFSFTTIQTPLVGILWEWSGVSTSGLNYTTRLQVASIIWSLIFSFAFYLRFPSIEGRGKNLDRYISGVILFSVFIGLGFLYGYLQKGISETGLTLYMFIILCIFLIVDFIFFRWHQDWKTRSNFKETLILVDVPIFIAFLFVMAVYFTYRQTEDNINEFLAGATAFQLFLSNFLFAFVQADIVKSMVDTSDKQIGFFLTFVEEGVFLYGPDQEEKYLPSFYMGVFPVTNSQYKRFVDSTSYPPPDPEKAGWVGDQFPPEVRDFPVVGVSRADALAFSEWAGLRLPTSEEWEKAARGTDGRNFPWGDSFDTNMCNISESQIGNTTSVNSYPEGKSPYGCYDMIGNVWEWTLSDENGDAILRGGSFYDSYNHAQLSHIRNHYANNPDIVDRYIGFRCCTGLPSSPLQI